MTFYPATLSPEQAERIDLAAEQNREGVDLVVPPAKLFTISGKLEGLPEGYPAVSLKLLRAPEGPNAD